MCRYKPAVSEQPVGTSELSLACPHVLPKSRGCLGWRAPRRAPAPPHQVVHSKRRAQPAPSPACRRPPANARWAAPLTHNRKFCLSNAQLVFSWYTRQGVQDVAHALESTPLLSQRRDLIVSTRSGCAHTGVSFATFPALKCTQASKAEGAGTAATQACDYIRAG